MFDTDLKFTTMDVSVKLLQPSSANGVLRSGKQWIYDNRIKIYGKITKITKITKKILNKGSLSAFNKFVYIRNMHIFNVYRPSVYGWNAKLQGIDSLMPIRNTVNNFNVLKIRIVLCGVMCRNQNIFVKESKRVYTRTCFGRWVSTRRILLLCIYIEQTTYAVGH